MFGMIKNSGWEASDRSQSDQIESAYRRGYEQAVAAVRRYHEEKNGNRAADLREFERHVHEWRYRRHCGCVELPPDPA